MPSFPQIAKRFTPNLRFAAILLALLFVLFGPAIWQGKVLRLGDVPDQFLPWRKFVAQELSEGRIPLWNRFSFCGAPFLANLQSTVLYPIDRFLDLFFDPARALMVGVALHLFFGGAFLYALARKWGACHTGATVAALGYAFGGFHAIHLWGGNLLTVTSSIYLPVHLLIVHLLSERAGSGRPLSPLAAMGAILVALQVTSGHAQMTFYNAFFVAIYTVGLVFRMGRGRFRFLISLVGMGIVGALLAAPQILPTLEYARFSSRQGNLPFDPATEFSFGWEFLLSFFVPEYLGTRADLNTAMAKDTYWGDWKNWSGVYLGILPAFGMIYLIVTQSGRWRLKLLLGLGGALALIALILSLGRNTPVYWFVHHYLPPFGKFRAPSKFLPGLIVPLAAIGASGVSLWMDDIRRRGAGDGKDRLKRNASICLAFGVLSLAAQSILVAVDRSGAVPVIVAREILRSIGFLGLAIGGLGLLQTGSRSAIASAWFLFLVAAADIGLYVHKYLPMANPDQITQLPSALIGKHRKGGERVLLSPEVPHANACLPLGIPNAGGYDPFQVRYYVEEFERIGYLDPKTVPDAWSPPPSRAAELGASFVISGNLLNLPGLTPLDKAPPWFLYRVENPAPLVEFVAEEGAPAALKWRWDGNDLEVEGEAPTDGAVVIRQTFAPGWMAESPGGERREIELLEPFWQKVPIPKGQVRLRLVYSPLSWRYGLVLFPFGLCGLAALAALGKIRKTHA